MHWQGLFFSGSFTTEGGIVVTLRHAECYRNLASDLKKIAETRTLVYIRNPGNWGDALIGAGERAFFDSFSIPIIEVQRSYLFKRLAIETRVRSKKLFPTIIYGGNGALSGPYYHLHGRIRLLLKGTVDSVLMPSTLPTKFEDFGFPKDLRLWRRDETLSRACERESRFCHDMAFFLSPGQVTVSKKIGNLFREDVEACTPGKIPVGNIDISNAGNHRSSISEFFCFIGQYEEINTDRLHVAIAAALLGRKVNLFSNNYGKIKAVYEASMAKDYPSVTYMGTRTP